MRRIPLILILTILTQFLAISQPDSTFLEKSSDFYLEPNEIRLIELLDLKVKEGSRNLRDYLILGSLYENQLKFDEAESIYSKALSIDSACSKCYQLLANVLTSKGRVQEAVKNYYQSLSVDSSNRTSRIQLARLLKRENRFKESVEQWRYLLLNDTSNFYIWEQIGDCALSLNDKGWAWNAYFNSYFLNPNNLQVAAKIGQIGVQQKVSYDYFEFIVDSALNIDSLYVPLLRVKGTMHFNIKNYKESILYYKKAVSQGDSSRATLKQLGISLNMRKQFSESVSYLDKFFMDDSTDLLVNYFLAKSLNNTGAADRAIKILNLSEKLMIPLPDEMSTLYEELSISYLIKNDHENALLNLQKAYESNPLKVELLISTAFYSEEIAGNKKLALEYFNKFIKEVEKLKALSLDVSKYEWEIERANMGIKRLTEELFFKDEL